MDWAKQQGAMVERFNLSCLWLAISSMTPISEKIRLVSIVEFADSRRGDRDDAFDVADILNGLAG